MSWTRTLLKSSGRDAGRLNGPEPKASAFLVHAAVAPAFLNLERREIRDYEEGDEGHPAEDGEQKKAITIMHMPFTSGPNRPPALADEHHLFQLVSVSFRDLRE